MSNRNVYIIDAADIDATNGLIVPKDLDTDNSGDTVDATAFDLDPTKKQEWSIKVVNDSDQEVDSLPLITTNDDQDFTEYDELTQLDVTVSTGSPPANVEMQDTDVIAGSVNTRLDVGAAATGTVKIVFESREMVQ